MEIPLLSWVSHFFIAAPNVSFREIILKENKFALHHGLIDFGTQLAGSTDFRPMAQQDHGQRAWQKKKKSCTHCGSQKTKREAKKGQDCVSLGYSSGDFFTHSSKAPTSHALLLPITPPHYVSIKGSILWLTQIPGIESFSK